ncbi:MAG TPA: hypothetical protein VLQ93_20105, partial [Myxococcaceae bacterium]|nr:hypothetical protein [Myxococcaceae bacterium]
RGAPATLAATRQECGYYEVVQELARVREEKSPPAPPPAPEVPSFATPAPLAVPTPVPAPAEQAPRTKGETVQQRIAPRKRSAAEAPPLAPEAPSFIERELPRPRGRFTRLDAPKASYQELLRVEGKEVLQAALEQNEHRFALLNALARQYSGSRGELTLPDVEGALRHHLLQDAMAVRERQNILSAFTEHRGATGRVGWALNLSPAELKQLQSRLELTQEIEEVRERFRREALTARLTQRLDLLGRDKYLADLGIKKRFTDMLRRELEVLVRDELPDATDLPGLAETVARKHGAPAELVLRALDRLELAEGLRQRLSADHDSTP